MTKLLSSQLQNQNFLFNMEKKVSGSEIALKIDNNQLVYFILSDFNYLNITKLIN